MKRKWGPILEEKLGSFYQNIFLYSPSSTSNAHFSFEQFSLVSVIFFLTMCLDLHTMSSSVSQDLLETN